MFCATSAYAVSWQHLNHQNLFVRSVYRCLQCSFVVLCTNSIACLGISLPHEDCFGKVESSYIKSEYYSVCDDYGVNADKTWMHGE